MIAMIDNFDSFTYNVVQALGALGAEPEVYRNNALSAAEIMAKAPRAVVISPGPSDPDHAGITLDMVRLCAESGTPLLGICLGHQAIGQAFGGRVEKALRPMHGKADRIRHTGKGLFAGLPDPLETARYHSLCVAKQSLPDVLEPTAWASMDAENDTVMAVQHVTKPIHGVQFHPESIATPDGPDLLKNFLIQSGIGVN